MDQASIWARNASPAREEAPKKRIGVVYFRNRYYSPETGRFLQRDPMGYLDSMGLYQFTANSPYMFGDPWGNESVWQTMGIDEDLSEGNTLTAYTKMFGYSFWNTLSFGALQRQDQLVEANEAGIISEEEYNAGTVVNAVGSTATAVATISSAGAVAVASPVAAGGLGASVAVLATTGSMVTEDFTNYASNQPVTSTTTSYFINQTYAAAIGFGAGVLHYWLTAIFVAPCSSKAPLPKPDLKNVIPDFDQFSSDQVYSGVYDPNTGIVVIKPSTAAEPTPEGFVPRRGGHARLQTELRNEGVNVRDAQAFTLFPGESGNFLIDFFSRGVNGLNPNFPGQTVPPELQAPIRTAVENATGRNVSNR